MLRHALKLIWNRRRSNRLVVIEIAAAFVVIFVLTSLSLNLWNNYRRPLGFDYENIWAISVGPGETGAGIFGGATEGAGEALTDVSLALRLLPRTVAVEPIAMQPFTSGPWNAALGADANSTFTTGMNRTTANALQAVGVTLVDGRWFGDEDDGQDYRAALVNRTFVERAFGANQNPIGKRINFPNPSFNQRLSENETRELVREVRVVGVIEDFRQHGDFSEEIPYVIERLESQDTDTIFSLLLKVAPGTSASYEEVIIATIESVAPDWVASITHWAQSRESMNAQRLLPLKASAIIASFFLTLVVMGLIGVLWQDVVRRTQEIGLRRALGAAAGTVRRQIHIEMLIVGVVGILIGTGIVIQFPLLELFGGINWTSAIPGILLSTGLILLLVTLGALYPSWLASRRDPSDALRYN